MEKEIKLKMCERHNNGYSDNHPCEFCRVANLRDSYIDHNRLLKMDINDFFERKYLREFHPDIYNLLMIRRTHERRLAIKKITVIHRVIHK